MPTGRRRVLTIIKIIKIIKILSRVGTALAPSYRPGTETENTRQRERENSEVDCCMARGRDMAGLRSKIL
jgi:hypothetical protein